MRPTIVLVHGAFAESASWDRVIDPLMTAGHPVIATANPLRGLAADAAAVGDLLRTVDGPVVLVGHSYGGAVISNVAADAAEITGLVYVAAFAPEPARTATPWPGGFQAAPSAPRCGRSRAATARPTCTSPPIGSTASSVRTCRRARRRGWPSRSGR